MPPVAAASNPSAFAKATCALIGMIENVWGWPAPGSARGDDRGPTQRHPWRARV